MASHATMRELTIGYLMRLTSSSSELEVRVARPQFQNHAAETSDGKQPCAPRYTACSLPASAAVTPKPLVLSTAASDVAIVNHCAQVSAMPITASERGLRSKCTMAASLCPAGSSASFPLARSSERMGVSATADVSVATYQATSSERQPRCSYTLRAAEEIIQVRKLVPGRVRPPLRRLVARTKVNSKQVPSPPTCRFMHSCVAHCKQGGRFEEKFEQICVEVRRREHRVGDDWTKERTSHGILQDWHRHSLVAVKYHHGFWFFQQQPRQVSHDIIIAVIIIHTASRSCYRAVQPPVQDELPTTVATRARPASRPQQQVHRHWSCSIDEECATRGNSN